MAFDAQKARRVIDFIQCLKHTKGEFHGKPFSLLPWQEKIITDVFGTVRDDDPSTRQYTTAYIEIPKKNGKELSLDTPIPTLDGWKTMGELLVGDRVFDENGQPCSVVALSPIDDMEQCYRITFRDGSVIDAGERHLWDVEYIIGKICSKQLTTREMYRELLRYRARNRGKREEKRSIVRIPVARPLEIPKRDLPFDPYVYGFWLGNGNAVKPELTVRTCDVEHMERNIPYEISSSWFQKGDGSKVLRIPALKPLLLPSFRDKTIQPEYLRASIAQRWALLQGLIDSDGSIGTRKAQSSYVSTIRPLAESVRELLWSLGIKNAMTEEPSTRYGVPTGEMLYTIRFTTFEDQPTSRLKRKYDRRRERVKETRSCFHYIRDIEPLPYPVKMRCIEVDSPSHQYLAGPSMVPTHNSELGAAIALSMLVNDGEWKAEVYSCAADRQQAAIVFDVAVDHVKQSPALLKRVKIIPSTKRMVYMPTGSIYQVLSSEVATKHGLNVSACIFDELHTQPTRALYDVMTQGSGDARKQPLWFFLTTAGTDRNSICWEVHQKALDILEGRKADPRFYPVIFGLPDDADWQDEKNWYKANPSLDHTISIDKVRDAFRKALETPADENMFRQLRLNQWVKQSIRWMPMDRWDECRGVVDASALEGRACYAGLDLSSTSDLTTLVLVFPPQDEDEPYMVVPFFWLPEETLQLRVRRDHVMYDVWAKQGFLNTTEGNVVHYGFMESKWTQAGEVLTAFSKKCDTIGKGLTKTGKIMTAAITAPIVALVATAIKASIDYESAFASVRKTVDATEAEFDSLSAAIKQMSTEVAASANDIAEVMAIAGQLGITNDHLVEFTRTMIDLGNSTDIVASDAAATVAKFANITSMDQSMFGNLGAALVDLGNNYATTESAIMEMSLRLAAAGHQVGLTESQILGFAAALSSVGIEAQMGGSAFSKALVKMEVASETGGQALKDFAKVSGMTGKEFKALWDSDPAAAFQAFIVGLSKMDDEGESAIVTLEEIGIKEVRLRDTLLRATNATELFSNTQATANAAWEENTALTEEAGKRYATTKSKLINLKNTALLFAQQIGDDLNPTIQQLIDRGNELLASFLGMDERQRMAIIRFAGFAAAAGPAILVLGKTVGAVGKVTDVLGKAGIGLGKFSASVKLAGGGLGGFTKTLLSSKLAVAALTAAIIYGAVQWIDYATGAKAARDALEGMNRTADEWRRNQAETIYSNDGLEAFGLSKESFAGSLQTAEQWRDRMLALWSDGKPETEEMIASYADSFRQLNEGTRTALEGMRDDAAESGHTSLSQSLQADIDALDAMDQEIEDLLTKRRNKNLTGKDKIRLDELLEQREAIQIKYKLTPEDTQGYGQIIKGIEDTVARAQAKGESGASVEVYEQGLTAAAQGYAAVTGEIDRQYDSERALIALVEDNEEKRAAYEALDEKYRNNRLAATQEYAAALRQIVSPVWEEEGIQKASADMDKLFLLFQQYSASGGEGAQDPAILEQMNTLFEGMDEGELISYLGLLQQVQGLLDGGMTEEEVNTMFPEMDMTGNISQLTALADFAKERSGELSGLSTILNDLVPEEMKKIAVDLDMTAAEQRWATFAENPGSVTTDAVIESYSEAETATKLQPVVDALISSYKEVEGGASTATLSPDGVVAQVSSYLEAEGADISALSPDQVEALVNSYSESTGCDKSALMQAFTAKIAAYDDTGAAKPSPSATIAITGYDLTAYNAFVQEHPVEVKGIVRLGEKYENPEDALNDPDAQFYLNGQQIPVDIVPKEKITADTLFVYDEDGTMHVLITPEIRGTPESVAEAEAPLNEKSAFLGGILDGSTLEWLAIVENRLRHINEEGNTWKYLWGASVGNSLKGAVEPLENVNVEDWAAVQTFVQETVAALKNGETLDEGVVTDLETIMGLVDMLETFNLQNNVTAGIGSAMEGAGWTMDAETVAANLQAVVDAAKLVGADVTAGVGEGMAGADLSTDAATVATNTESALRAPGAFDSSSPANRTKPVGRDAAAGIGAGMAEYDLSYSAAAVATNVSTGLQTALSGGAIKSIGKKAMVGLGLGILSGKASVVTAIRIVANSAVAAAKEALKIQSPSRVFRDEIGAMAMKGFGEGVLRETEAQARAIRNAARYLAGEAEAGVSNSYAYDNRRTYNQQASTTVKVERLYVRDEQDVRSLAIEIAQLTKRQQAALGAR